MMSMFIFQVLNFYGYLLGSTTVAKNNANITKVERILCTIVHPFHLSKTSLKISYMSLTSFGLCSDFFINLI